MKFLILLGLCALAASRLPNPQWLNEIEPSLNIQDKAFRSGREYRYIYNGQLTTGVPGASSQHSATRLQAVVSLIFESEQAVLLQLTHVRMGKLNQHVPSPRSMIPFVAFQEVPIEQELKQKLHKPVKFIYEDGLIKDVEFDGAEEPWSANIKRGVMNMIQVNMKAKRRTDIQDLTSSEIQNSQNEENEYFTSIENTLEGECETATTITNGQCEENMHCKQIQEENVLNVTKSINFQKCTRRPDIKYNFRFQDYCPSCDKKYSEPEKLIQSSTIIKLNILGNRENFVVEQAKVNSQHTFAPFNEQQDTITSHITQTLQLLKTGTIQTRIPQPRNPIESDSDMIFTPDWDILKEEFFQKGEEEFLEQTPYSEVQNKINFVKQILRSLVSQMSNQEVKQEAPRQFARLVKILRMCKRSEIEQILSELVLTNSQTQLTQEQSKIVKDLVIDALGVCGTQECVKQLVDKTKRRQINPIRAAMAIKSLINVRVPSKTIIDEILSICEQGSGHEFCSRNPFLKQTVYLTAGSIMNALCAETPDKWAQHFKLPNKQAIMNKQCPRVVKERYVQLLINKFKQTNSWYEKVLALKSLGNAGIDLSIYELEKIITNEGTQYTPVIRMEAIIALRQLRETMPRKIQRILMPIFMNKFEAPGVRVAAMYLILQTQPEKSVLDQIVRKVSNEPSRQVASFIFSYLHTMANSTDPCEKKIADNLKQSLRHAKGQWSSQVLSDSFLVHKSAFWPKHQTGIALNLAHMRSNQSIIPSIFGAAAHGNYLGFWQKYLAAITFIQEDTEDLLRQYLSSDSIFAEKTLDELLFPSESESRESPRDTRTSRNELKNIFRQLGIQNRRQRTSFNPKAHITLKFKDQEVAILPFSLETMPQEVLNVVSQRGFNIRSIERHLRSGINMNVHTGGFVQEITRKIPTTLGLPVVLTVKIPTVASINGEIKLKIEPENSLETVKTQFDLKPSLVSTLIVKMEAWSPVINSGLKVLNQLKVNVPLKGKVEINNIAQGKPQVTVLLKTIPRRNNLLTAEARPITYTRVWPKFLQTWQEPQEITVPCEELKKISTSDSQFGEKIIGVKYRLRTDWRNSPLKYKVKITNEPGLDCPKEVILKVTPQSIGQRMQSSLRSNMENIESLINEQCESECEINDYYCQLCRSEKTKENNRKAINYVRSFVSQTHTKDQMKIELFSKGSPSNTERRLQIQTNVKCGIQHKLCVLDLDLIRTPVPQFETNSWRLKCKGQSLYPHTPSSFSQLGSDKKYISNLKCNWGTNEQDMRTKFIDIKTKAQQSGQQIKEIEESQISSYCLRCQQQCQESWQSSSCQSCKAFCSPVSLYEKIAQLSDFCQIDIDTTFGNVHPAAQNITNKIFRALKYAYYQESDVNQIRIRNPENKIKARITIEPKTHKYVNITIQTPKEKTKLKNIEMKQPVVVWNSKLGYRSSLGGGKEALMSMITEGRWRNEDAPICKVHSHKLVTFDQSEYRAPLTTCYSVLAKDCSNAESSKFAVLMKKLSPESEEKKVKIITQKHTIELEPEATGSWNQLKVKVNGQEVEIGSYESQEQTLGQQESEEQSGEILSESEPISIQSGYGYTVNEHGHAVVSIEKVGSYLKCVLPEVGVKVYFDGWNANIKMSPMFRSIQCGLCGQFDSEPENEFQTASLTQPQNMQEFHKSYLIQNGCQLSQEEQQRIQNINEYQTLKFGSIFSESGESSESSTEESIQYLGESLRVQPKLKTKVIEHGNEICFSKTPIPVCPRNAYATSYQEQQQRIEYACQDRDEIETEIMHQQVLRAEAVSIGSLPASFTETEPVPRSCARI